MSFKRNRDNANYQGGSANRHLPSGLYKVRVVNCVENENKRSYDGSKILKPHFSFEFDIAEGEYANFFMDEYERFRANSSKAFWACRYDQFYEGNSAGHMDALINRFEDSNKSFRYRDDGGRCFEGFNLVASIQAVESKTASGYSRWRYDVKQTYAFSEVKSGKDLDGNDINIVTYNDKLADEKGREQANTPTNYNIGDDDIAF